MSGGHLTTEVDDVRRVALDAHDTDLRATRSRSALPSVSRATSNDPVQRTYGTLPEASRRFGIGLKKLRQRAAEGAFPIYSGETAWPRIKFAEVEEWLRSTRVPITQHARSRVDEVLEREYANANRLEGTSQQPPK